MHLGIYEKLIEVASARSITNYTEVGEIAGLNMESPADRNQIAAILDEINIYEDQQGHPMLSAVVVRLDKNMPGAGFFECARQLGRYQGSDDLVFWAHELTEVHHHWCSH
jgi:hypothetical protein